MDTEVMDTEISPQLHPIEPSQKDSKNKVLLALGALSLLLIIGFGFLFLHASQTKQLVTKSISPTPAPRRKISTIVIKPTTVVSPTVLPTPPPPLAQGPVKANILVLEYFPLDPNDSNKLDATETGWNESNMTVLDWEANTQKMISGGIESVNEATRYHGYKDPNAVPFITYSVIATKIYHTAIPRGVRVPWNTNNSRPQYGQILRDENICDYVDNKNTKEVWMWGYHHDGTIEPDESRMSSKYGDISNSGPKEETIPEEYRMPICKNSYVLYNFTYQPGRDPNFANTLHNRGHQIENEIGFIDSDTFWNNFSEKVFDTTTRIHDSSCGNIHFPPNWRTGQDGYQYSIQEARPNNCETWNPDPSKTTYVTKNCEQWGCTDLGFYKWWMQNMPGYQNGITFNGHTMRNWWEAMYDFNSFVDKAKSLYN